jgi:glycosyltransferase involved in cell wall biosynthesis
MDQTQPTKLPKVSVIIAVYNNKQYFPDALASAISQDYPNLDVWIVSDASTEDIWENVEPWLVPTGGIELPFIYERKDEIETYKSMPGASKPVYYVRLRKNGGPARARNIAILNAVQQGSHLFQILDSDDVMYPNKVTTLIRPILENPNRVAISYGDYIIQDASGVCRYEAKPPYDYSRFFGGDCHIHSGCLVNGLALQNIMPKPYPEDQRVCEDYFMERCILRNRQWVAIHIGQPLTLVRSHSNDSTSSVSKEIWTRDYQKTMTNS